jgi:uncharacterized caspase-like protein
MGQTLSGLGFEVISAIDASRREMNRSLQTFLNAVQPGDVALVFYAGHAIEIGDDHYLLPVDIPPAKRGQEAFVRGEAISRKWILDTMEQTKARVKIAILDACRDNPFASKDGRSVGGSRGLTPILEPGETFVMYSASAEQVALDRLSDADPDPNSVFTRTLLPLMQRPGLDLVDLAREVRRGVNRLAASVGHEQTPAYTDGILGEFKFAAIGDAPTPPPAPPSTPQTPSVDGSAIDLAFWQWAEKKGTVAAYQAYLDRFPNGAFADLARLEVAEPTGPTPEELAARDRELQIERERAVEAERRRAERAALVRRNQQLEDEIARFKAEQRGPSYDCSKARRRDEIMICDSPQLSALDRVLAQAYRSARSRSSNADKGTLRAEQAGWLKDRGRCSSERCIDAIYRDRIRQLKDW